MVANTSPSTFDEAARQRALDRYRVVDSLPDEAYQDIVRVAAAVCETPMALITLLDRDRQWFKARVGLDAEQTPRNVAVCEYAVRNPDELLEVPDLAADQRFADFPAVTGTEIGARFYAGMPLVTPEGAPLGTVCVIDREPRELSDAQRTAMEALARITMHLLEARLRDHAHVVTGLLDHARADSLVHTPAATATDTGYAIAILELQGWAHAVQQRGERGVEKELHALELLLEPLLDRAQGDTLDRVTGSPEFVAVLQGGDTQPRRQAIEEALRGYQQRSSLCVLLGAAQAESAREATQQVFMRADAALSARKDAQALAEPTG